MNADEIMDLLAENECTLFYAHCRDPKNEALAAAYAAAKQALEAYAQTLGIYAAPPAVQ